MLEEGVTTRSVQNRTRKERLGEINLLQNRQFAYADGLRAANPRNFLSNARLGIVSRQRFGFPTPLPYVFEQIVW